MNVLLTSAGRRNYIVDYFVSALGEHGVVHVSNSSQLCSSFTYAGPKVISPMIYDPGYVEFLVNYCESNDIEAIVPLFDVDLPVLAKAVERFEQIGVKLVTGDLDAVEICNDKARTVEFLTDLGIKSPLTFDSLSNAKESIEGGSLHFPVIVKPRWGMGSIGLSKVSSLSELDFVYDQVRRECFDTYLKFESGIDDRFCVLIQEVLEGTEHGLDVLNDLEGKFVITNAKTKLAMRSGETDIARTVRDHRLEKLGERVGRKLRHRGNLDMDIFLDGDSVSVLELNCRFGGGYPFTHLAGGNYVEAIVSWLRGQEVDKESLRVRPNVTCTKVLKPEILTCR
jgi:carbamoyl-phosphate synthase large subunit